MEKVAHFAAESVAQVTAECLVQLAPEQVAHFAAESVAGCHRNPHHLKFLEFHRAEEAIAEGYKETKAQLDCISREGGWFDVF